MTTQHPSFLVVKELKKERINYRYGRKDSSEGIEVKGEGIGWAALGYKKSKQSCVGVYV